MFAGQHSKPISRLRLTGESIKAAHPRPTYGEMAWAVTRTGVLRAGLYDENYVTYFEDNDYSLRLMLAGLDRFALAGVTAFHGETNGKSKGYTPGNDLMARRAGKEVEHSAEVKRMSPKTFFRFKWGGGGADLNPHI